MPKKTLPTPKRFARFQKQLRKLGFSSVPHSEMSQIFKQLDLSPPRPRPGREVGLKFPANGLTVYVWARDVHAGGVFVCEEDNRPYIAHSFRSMEYFFLNLFRAARLAGWRVLNRPCCPKCSYSMRIVVGRGRNLYGWRCDRIQLHDDRNPMTLPDWYVNLPSKRKRIVEVLRDHQETIKVK